jgi:membrane protein implicated in regulation of membrane protease activity
MKLHLITSFIVALIVTLVVFILNSPLFLSFVLFALIVVLCGYGTYKLYRAVYQSVKNIFG